MNDNRKPKKNTAADILRSRMLQANVNKESENDDGTKLSELGGIEYLHEEIKNKLYNTLFNRHLFKKALMIRSVLVYGISGVGKNTLVRCFAREHKIPVLHKIKFESCLEVKELFMKAKNLARAIVLIDNLEQYEESKDIYIQINECVRKSAEYNYLVVFLHKDRNLPVFYDTEIFMKIPTVAERKEILDKLLSKIEKRDIDTETIAFYTPGFVPRMLERLVRITGLEAMKMQNDHENLCLTMENFESALKMLKNIVQSITFDQIGAMEKVKEELKMSILYPSKFVEKYKKLGIHKPSGILLYGPPGCGKTLIAKAVSNMSHCNFLSIKGPELITKYVGDSEKHLRDLFEKAKNLSPCVLFFDEIDSLCGKRGKNEFGNRIVNQILTLLDGIEDRGEVYLIGATNRIDQIDKAMLRTGRFDKVIEVPLPEKAETYEIFRTCVANIPVEMFDVTALDFSGFSGADIAGVVKEAAFLCIKDNFECENIAVTKEYFIKAIEKIRSMKLKENTEDE